MNPRASELIDLLDLKPHPEGGFFREIFRSSHTVRSSNSRKERSALTEIYFLLTADDCSRWHQVDQDEAFHYYEGAALELFWIEEGNKKYCRQIVGEIGEAGRPVAIVPAGCWQGARTSGEYTLVGCTVAPGFDFADFRLLRDNPEETRILKERFPELAMLV